MMLLENSFYTNQSDLATLLSDKTKVADIFYLNFIGFTGLFKIKDAPILTTYVKSLGKLQLRNMTDANKDWSIVVKLAHDAGVINTVAANQATKFLVKIRTGKIKSSDIQDDPIRDILKACRIVSNRPSMRIYRIVTDFMDGKANLEKTTYALWKASKLPDFQGCAAEMSNIITVGGFVNELIKHGKPAGTSAPTITTQVTSPVRSPSSAKPTRRGKLPPPGSAHGSDSDYMAALLHMFTLKGGIHSYLDRFGFKTNFDANRLLNAIKQPEFVATNNYGTSWEQHPFVKWVTKQNSKAGAELLRTVKDLDTIALAVQLGNIQSQQTNTQPAAPKPSVVIQTVKTPILNSESIRELYLAKTKVEFDAVLKKYNIPEDPAGQTRVFYKLHREDELVSMLYSFSIPDLATTSDISARVFELEYGEFSSRVLAGIHRGLKFIPILRTIVDASEKKDLKTVLKIFSAKHFIHHFNENWRTWNNSRINLRSAESILRAAAGSSVYQILIEALKMADPVFAKEIFDLVKGSMNQAGDQRVIFFLFDSYSTYRKRKIEIGQYFEQQFIDMFKNAGVTAFVNLSKITLDQDEFKNLSVNAQTLLNLMAEKGMIDLEVKKIDSTELFRQRFAKMLAESNNGWKSEVKNEAINTLETLRKENHDVKDLLKTHVEASRFTRVLRYTSDTGAGPNWQTYEWAFEYLAKANVDWSYRTQYQNYNSSNFDGAKFYAELLVKKSYNEELAKFAEWIIQYYDGATFIGEMGFTTAPQIKKIAIQAFANRGMQGTTIARAIKKFDAEVVELLSRKESFNYLSVLADDLSEKEIIETFNIVTKNSPLLPDSSKHTSRSPYISGNNPGSTWDTCWFIRPGHSDYEDAKLTAKNVSSAFVEGQGPNFHRIFKVINPELYTWWLEDKKANIGGNLKNLLPLKTFIQKDELSKLTRGVIKDFDVDQIKADLTHSHGAALKVLSELPEYVDDDTKKEMLTKYSQAMEVVNVHNIKERSQRDFVNRVYSDLLLSVYDIDKNLANEAFANAPRTTRSLIVKSQGETEYLEFIKDDLYKHPIKPDFPLDHSRIRQILKYNNIPIKITSNKAIVKTLDDVALAVKKGIQKVGDLNISEPKVTNTDLDRATIRINKFRNNNHGDVAIKILKIFDVNFPGNKERQEAFRKEFPRDGTLMPVFHGTGTVAASMILRNGFQIIPSNDSSAVGRMLGNGIYFSNISNKASQYVGDKGGGITRRYGTRGYVFEMEAELGLSPKHYRSAGTGGDRSVRSPEWAVFRPADQLRIYRAYYVELVNVKEIEDLADKYGEKLNENVMLNFNDFLYETRSGKDVSTFWFMDGAIPTGLDKVVELEDYKTPANVFIEPFGDGGVMVSVEHDKSIESTSVTIPNAAEWIATKPHEVEHFLGLIKS